MVKAFYLASLFHAGHVFLQLSGIRKGQMLYCNYFLGLDDQEGKLRKQHF
jgi:hypothetical protein